VNRLPFTAVPVLALVAALVWSTVHIGQVEGRGEPELYARAVAFEKSLTAGPGSSPLEFVHPTQRGNARLRAWIGNLEREFSNSRGSQILQSKVVAVGAGESTYAVEKMNQLATVEFRWSRAEDGLWYVVPRNL
jgi:hypothetical protein